MSQIETTDPRIITYNSLRRWVGALGVSLPLILILGSVIIGQCDIIQESISHYYYTRIGDVFVGILCAVAFFLLIYKGYDPPDNRTTNATGFFALCVAFFPTSQNNSICSVLEYSGNNLTEMIHYTSAAVFFTLTAYMTYFRFTLSKGVITDEKRKRNRVYRICGVIIMTCVAAILLVHLSNDIVENTAVVFALEWIALMAFGIAWLLKGEAGFTTFLQDKDINV